MKTSTTNRELNIMSFATFKDKVKELRSFCASFKISRNIVEKQIKKSRSSIIQIREITGLYVFIVIVFSTLLQQILVSYCDHFCKCISRLRQQIQPSSKIPGGLHPTEGSRKLQIPRSIVPRTPYEVRILSIAIVGQHEYWKFP